MPQSDSGQKRKAFTLIELLIVVAIIAILAAIAVPNFLEAQVRAKVARCKADMRTLATAHESYNVDWNVPTPGQTYGRALMGWPNNSDLLSALSFSVLTTPIAYITSRPLDPFGKDGGKDQFERQKYYLYQSYWAGAKSPNSFKTIHGLGFTWHNHSIGPWRDTRVTSTKRNTAPNILAGINPDGGPGLFVYDPTNGTASPGLIMRTNKGIYTGPSTQFP